MVSWGRRRKRRPGGARGELLGQVGGLLLMQRQVLANAKH